MRTKAEEREHSILRIMSTCVHFTGIQNEKCKAGVNYHGQFGTGMGCFANIPCTHEPGENLKECQLAKYPTREEAKAEREKRDARIKRNLTAISIAHDDAKAKGLKKGHGGASEVKCPLCETGMIRYSVASINGHMHAGCTNRCVSWME